MINHQLNVNKLVAGEISYSAAKVATTRMQLMWWMVNHQFNVNKLDALALIHPQVVVEEVEAEEVVAEEVVATSEAEKAASPDKPKSQRIKHTARKNIHYVRRSTRPHS